MPPLLDYTMRASVIAEQRGLIVPSAGGHVLEIGIGSGLNLPYYDEERVERIYGLDPSAALERRARRRAARSSFPVEIVEGAAEAIPASDGFFDTVVSTYTLCSVSNLSRALGEIRRVLKPDGRYLFCEHGRTPDAPVARWQDRLTPAWKHVAGGCHLNIAMSKVIEEAGFKIEELSAGYLAGPKTLAYNYRGVARP